METHLHRGIDHVMQSRNFYRWGSQVQTALLATLSGATTLLIALDQTIANVGWQVAALVTSALATIVTAFTAWFHFRALWISNNIILTKLWSLRDKIEYDKARLNGHVPDGVVDEYFATVQGIFAELNKRWQEIRESGG